MPADLNKSLEECEMNAKALVAEMRKYKGARELNQKAADALDKVTECLSRVISEIKPLTANRLRMFIIVQTIAWLATTLIAITLLVLVLMRKA